MKKNGIILRFILSIKMRFKVPQDVQREDQILLFITFRQLIFLLIGGGASYLLFVTLSKTYNLNSFDYVIISIPFLLALALAFLKIHGITIFKFILLILEQTFFRASKRFWVKGAGTPFVSMTTNFAMGVVKKKAAVEVKDASGDRIKNLARILDGEKSDFQKQKDKLNNG